VMRDLAHPFSARQLMIGGEDKHGQGLVGKAGQRVRRLCCRLMRHARIPRLRLACLSPARISDRISTGSTHHHDGAASRGGKSGHSKAGRSTSGQSCLGEKRMGAGRSRDCRRLGKPPRAQLPGHCRARQDADEGDRRCDISILREIGHISGNLMAGAVAGTSVPERWLVISVSQMHVRAR